MTTSLLNTSQALQQRYRPSDIALIGEQIIEDLDRLAFYEDNRVIGMRTKPPTNASTQLTGAGATDWNVDMEPGEVRLGGVRKVFELQVDFAVHAATQVPGLDALDTVVSAIICENIGGTLTLKTVHGSAATTASGAAVGPTDAQVVAALATATNDWIKVCELTINRTADTTVTQSQDNSKRVHLRGLFPNFGNY